MARDYDVAVVGSGFGGSVTALRLAEKGYRVVVLEAGRRFSPDELPRTSWQVRRFLWAPQLRCFGIQRISVLRNVVVLAGAGVGGGSLVYANTLYEPPEPFFRDPQWRDITDWQAELRPFYDQARRMLGVVENPTMTPSDEAMRQVADEMGAGHTFRSAPVGVWFGSPGETVDDPYFGGAGPTRTGCIECGSCMTGCRFNAKNTLPSNYLYLAERLGAEVRPLTTVKAVRPAADDGYVVETVRTGTSAKGRARLAAEHVVFAAGALGTQRLLHRMRDDRVLPRLSPALGRLTRTNSEALLGAISRRRDADYTRGVAITSSWRPDAHTHVEPVRYGKGSNLMGLLATVLVDGGRLPRWLRWAAEQSKHPLDFFRSLDVRGWSERTVIALVMQTLDNSLTVSLRHGPFGRRRLTSRQGHGEPNPVWIPVAHEAVRRLARVVGGKPGGTWSDVVNVPMTAHVLGGCVIGASADDGVVDPYHRVYGQPGLHVVDGSAVSANLGVNPSLTITAQAERAMSLWPNRGDPDPRPPLGEPYRRAWPVPPRTPAVPASAPAALRLPVP